MIPMKTWATQAVKKLESEKKAVIGNKEKAMKGAVFAAIKDFCMQDEEFAQAVVQGGSFAACMTNVAAGVGNSISDLDALKKAVKFYFPGAEVRMQLTIDLIGAAAEEDKPQAEPAAVQRTTVAEQPKIISLDLDDINLDLADFFG